jgi:TonB family protein
MQGKKSNLLSWRIAAGVIIVAAGLTMVFIPFTSQEELTAQTTTPGETASPLTADTVRDSTKPEGLLSLEKTDAQPEPDVTSELRQQSIVAPPTTNGVASGPASTTADEQLADITEKEAEEIAEELVDEQTKDADRQLSYSIESDSTAVTIVAAHDAVPQKVEAKKGEDASASRQASRLRSAESAKRSAEQGGRTISGQVIDSEEGLPLPGVNVTVNGTKQGTVTDLNGNYRIEVPASRNALSFSFIGMQTNEVKLQEQEVVNIKMAEDVSQLSEVVVTGYAPPASAGEPVIRLAEPIGGRKAYDKYLENELRYPQQAIDNNVRGRVTVQFTVDTRGIIGDLEVTKKLGYGCDEEVIRLVKEGPKWLPTTQDAVPIESIVRVRMKFDPRKRKK